MPVSPPSLAQLDGIAHIIQVALAPVFLFNGIGTLINVFSNRLECVSLERNRSGLPLAEFV